MSAKVRRSGSNSRGPLTLLHDFDHISFGIVDLKIPCALAVTLNWPGGHAPCRKHPFHLIYFPSEENRCLISAKSFFSSENDRVSIFFKLISGDSLSPRILCQLPQPEFFDIP
jgi:hypothetical protein